MSHHPTGFLQPIIVPFPFYQWGIDIVGPIPSRPSQKKFLLVAVDYFSKWVKVEVAKITENVILQFLWKNIVCRYRIP